MRRVLTGIIAGLVLAALCSGQESPQNNQPQSQPSAAQPRTPNSEANGAPRIAPGSVIPVQLTKTIDAKKAKTGDSVEAKVTQDLKTQSGEVILPKDTKVTGHVTEAQAHSKEQPESQVGIAFDHAVTKTGTDMSMPMSIQAIIAPPSMNANSNNAAPSSSTPGGGSGMPSGGRAPGMSGSTQQAPNPPTAGQPAPSYGETGNASPQITAKTEGVVGMSNLKLSPAPNAAEGSIVSSEKNNVKIESGTLMLLRVSQ